MHYIQDSTNMVQLCEVCQKKLRCVGFLFPFFSFKPLIILSDGIICSCFFKKFQMLGPDVLWSPGRFLDLSHSDGLDDLE